MSTDTPHLYRDYTTKVFGYATFGRIYGSITAVSGLGQFVQPALDALTHGPLHDNPMPINLVFAVAGTVISATLTVFVYLKTKEAATEPLDGGKNMRYGEDLVDEERRALLRDQDLLEAYGSALRDERR